MFGIYFYASDEELTRFKTYLAQISNASFYRFKLSETVYRSHFAEIFDLPTREMRLIENLYRPVADKSMPDYYYGRPWILRYNEVASMSGQADLQVNIRSLVESDTDEVAKEMLHGMGFRRVESHIREGIALKSPEGVETLLFSVSFPVSTLHVDARSSRRIST